MPAGENERSHRRVSWSTAAPVTAGTFPGPREWRRARARPGYMEAFGQQPQVWMPNTRLRQVLWHRSARFLNQIVATVNG